MHFTHDTSLTLGFAAALVNTEGEVEGLSAPEDIDGLLDAYGPWTGFRSRDAAEVAQVQAVRPRLRAYWQTDDSGRADLANRALRDAAALPQVVSHDHLGWHIHAVEESKPLAERIVVEVALAMVDLLRAEQTHRLSRCEATDCDGVVADLSRNRSRRYCSTACTNRVAAAAYRARQTQ